MVNIRSVIISSIFISILWCTETNGQDEVSSAGNKTVIIKWYLEETKKTEIICKVAEGNSAPNLTWKLNVNEVLQPLPEDIKYFKENDGSVSLQFAKLNYEIMDAYGAVKKGLAAYTCVSTGENLPTNHTTCVILVQTYRSAGTVALAVFLLFAFLALTTLFWWKLQFNHKTIQAVPT